MQKGIHVKQAAILVVSHCQSRRPLTAPEIPANEIMELHGSEVGRSARCLEALPTNRQTASGQFSST